MEKDTRLAHDEADEQWQRWNGPAGLAWVETQELLDRLFQPFEALLVDAVTSAGRRHVLDVGCGTGSTTLAIARRLGDGGCTGIDISEAMLGLAQARAEREHTGATFIRADAATYPFGPATFDGIVSRFGVMFFGDPVGAFANLRRATTDNGGMCLIVWRSADENRFMTTAERAAAPLLPNRQPRRPDAPGQFAFANGVYVRSILERSGWKDIDVQALDVPCAMPESALLPYLTRFGPVGIALQEVDEQPRADIVATVRAAFDPFVDGEVVRFIAACWTVTARA